MIGAVGRPASSPRCGRSGSSPLSPPIRTTSRISRAMEPASPAEEAAFWYQYYFHNERGRRGLTMDRRAIARLLWRMWSPTWAFDDATFERTAGGFDNP